MKTLKVIAFISIGGYAVYNFLAIIPTLIVISGMKKYDHNFSDKSVVDCAKFLNILDAKGAEAYGVILDSLAKKES